MGGRVEIIRGPERRRRWINDEELQLVAEACRPGNSVSLVARLRGINARQLFGRRNVRRGLRGHSGCLAKDGQSRPRAAHRFRSEWLVAVAPLQDGLVMELLRYAEELRNPSEYFDEVPAANSQKDMVDLAVELMEKKSGTLIRRSSRITTARRSRSSYRRR
jgi:transposase-like protein